MANITKSDNVKGFWGGRTSGTLSIIAGKNVKAFNTSGKPFSSFFFFLIKLSIHLQNDWVHISLGIKRNKNSCLVKDSYRNIYSMLLSW